MDKRVSNIELLRIITMFFIVLFHYHIPLNESNYTYDGSRLIWFVSDFLSNLAGFGGKVGVQIFVIISGYFLVDKTFDKIKLFRFIFQCYFWNVAVLFFVILVLGDAVTTYRVVESFIPFTPLNWFARAYLLLYLAYPYLNKYIVYRLPKKKLFQLIGVGVVAIFLLPTIFQHASSGYASKFILFCELYLIGAYMKLYANDVLSKWLSRIFVLSGIILLLVIVAYSYQHVVDESFYIPIGRGFMYQHDNAFLALCFSCGVVHRFLQLKIGYNTMVNKIASTTFAVYLIHGNSLLIEQFDIPFKGPWLYTYPYLVPFNMIMTGIVVFAICSLLEMMRSRYVEKPLLEMLNKKWKKPIS